MATSDYDSDRDPRWQFRCALLQRCICGSGHTYHHISNLEHAFCCWSNLVFGNGLHCQGTSKCICSTFPIFCLPLFSFCEQRSKLGMWACARFCIFNSPDGPIWLIALLSTRAPCANAFPFFCNSHGCAMWMCIDVQWTSKCRQDLFGLMQWIVVNTAFVAVNFFCQIACESLLVCSLSLCGQVYCLKLTEETFFDVAWIVQSCLLPAKWWLVPCSFTLLPIALKLL